MKPNPPLVAAVVDYIAHHENRALSYVWKVSEPAWAALATGFDHSRYAEDLPQQNIELKRHLASHWAAATLDEKIRIATWIVSDWGGIRRNSPMTMLGYVNQADAERPATPFVGISSYSKILSIKDPDKYAIFDARVAASLNAIQLLADPIRRPARHLRSFLVPMGRNEAVKRFDEAFNPARKDLGFIDIVRDQIYGTYTAMLLTISAELGKSVLEIEMILFGQANHLCDAALPLLRDKQSA
jgi:hypothetical protein